MIGKEKAHHHHRPEAEHNLDLAKQMPEPGMASRPASKMLEELGRKSMQDGDPENGRADDVESGWSHDRIVALSRGILLAVLPAHSTRGGIARIARANMRASNRRGVRDRNAYRIAMVWGFLGLRARHQCTPSLFEHTGDE